jgi:hypothetical protein
MDTLRSVLKKIQDGMTHFEPTSNDEKDMRDFQTIAKVLMRAHDQGLLESCVPHKESATGNRWYDSVLVSGGLSYKGEKFLTEPTDKNIETKLDEIVQRKSTPLIARVEHFYVNNKGLVWITGLVISVLTILVGIAKVFFA